MKNSITVLEFILTILLISIFYTSFIPKQTTNKLDIITDRLIVQLKYLRYKSMISSVYYPDEINWHKKRWSIKFFRCNKNVGGIYYNIFSDTNKTGHVNQIESLKDPLSNKFIYSSKFCTEELENSKYTLLSKKHDINNIEITCNSTSSLGQLSFGYEGRIYSKLSDDAFDNEINESCIIDLISNKYGKRSILIERTTGFIREI